MNQQEELNQKIEKALASWDEKLLSGVMWYIKNLPESIKSKIDVNFKGAGGRTLLHLGVAKGSKENVRLLVHQYKADLRATDEEGNIPLHFAKGEGVAGELIPDDDATIIDIKNTAYSASSNKHIPDCTILEIIVSKPKKVASEPDKIKMVKFLLEKGASIEGLDARGRNILQRALDTTQPEFAIIATLLRHEINPNFVNEKEGKNTLQYLLDGINSSLLDQDKRQGEINKLLKNISLIQKELLKEGVNLNFVNEKEGKNHSTLQFL